MLEPAIQVNVMSLFAVGWGLSNCHNPTPAVFLLDEVDKLGRDPIRGDPTSALLEVLDPEQNSTFRDHYLNVPFDLSRVLFVATANSLDSIPPPLLDRMEVIPMAGYTLEEKLHIARRYLLPKQRRLAGLAESDFLLDDAALRFVVESYTREPGVRNLERQLAAICRSVAFQIASSQEDPQSRSDQRRGLDMEELDRILGVYLEVLADEMHYNA